MLVYGDRSERAAPNEWLERIAEQLARIAEMPPGLERHARLVSALIGAGQLLQGIADADFHAIGADPRTSTSDGLTRYTCAIARAVCRSWDSSFDEIGEIPSVPRLDDTLNEVELRIPEGFAYYAVYPEAYAEAARRLRLAGPPLVIGIRSIGTTLGAVVAAALGGPPPVTVRPHGHPFARQITVGPELERELLHGNAHYVIVDEGPGQSGSSFGAVADWLEARGVPLSRIAFLPSHHGMPGPCASEAHRRRWAAAQLPPADFGERLPQLLKEWLALETTPVDVSAGEWRRHVYAREEDWPAAMASWERRKFLAQRNGERLLLKFAGLGAIGECKLGLARALHSAGIAPEPLALAHGFLVERWCEGRRLAAGEKPIGEIARYIGARARLFPAEADSGATLGQLLEMGERNVSLAFGDAAAASLQRWKPRLDALARRVVRVRTDNKLDRHEWVCVNGGRLLKTDALDHHAAHDLVGCQDMAWDLAGAIVEFDLDERESDALIAPTERASGRHVDRELLAFYRLAYSAFRLGQAVLAAQMAQPAEPELQRLGAAASRYTDELRHLLPESSCARKRLRCWVDGSPERTGRGTNLCSYRLKKKKTSGTVIT